MLEEDIGSRYNLVFDSKILIDKWSKKNLIVIFIQSSQ